MSENAYCYILYNTNVNENKKTYNGYTVNLQRRIRQHNGEIKGGARYTSNNATGQWKYLVVIHSPEFSKHSALSMEWHVKYPNNKRPRPSMFQGVIGRLNSLPLVFNNPKFVNMSFTVTVDPQYVAHVTDLLSPFNNVIVCSCQLTHVV